MNTIFKKVIEMCGVDFFDNKNEIVTNPSMDNIEEIIRIEQSRTSNRHQFKYLSSVKNDQEVLIKNFGNPFCSIQINRKTIVLEEDDVKVSLKIFYFDKHRERGQVFFRKHSTMRYVTFNKNTCELFSGVLRQHHKKRKKVSSIKRNLFIKSPFETILGEIRNCLYYVKHSYNPEDDLDVIMNTIRNTLYNSLGYTPDGQLYLNDFLYKKYLEKKGVKYPNNFQVFKKVIPLITKREFKKTKFKMVDAVMKRYSLKGDRVRKILHEINDFNAYNFKLVLNFFGVDFILQKDEKFLRKLFETNADIYIDLSRYDIENFTKKERNNCFEILNLVLNKKIEVYTFLDHMDFYFKVKKYEDIKWNSKEYTTFNREHLEWSEKVEYYTRATYERKYDQEFIDEIQKEIKYFDEAYYPVVLTKTPEYIEESSHQNNCVRTYIDRASSFIISLRKGDKYSNERATIEYRIRRNEKGNIIFNRVQTLGRFNQRLSETWDKPIELLDELIFDNINSFKDMSIDKITVTGVQNIESYFTPENNEIVWDINEDNFF